MYRYLIKFMKKSSNLLLKFSHYIQVMTLLYLSVKKQLGAKGRSTRQAAKDMLLATRRFNRGGRYFRFFRHPHLIRSDRHWTATPKKTSIHGGGYTDTFTTIAACIFRFAHACEPTILLIISSLVTPWQARVILHIEEARGGRGGRERERENNLIRVSICVERNREIACKPVTHARVW